MTLAPSQVVVFGGGSFGTAIASCLAKKKKDIEIVLLLRDQGLCDDINRSHCNTRYLPVSEGARMMEM
jgi:glycerol-3-phosphate dehydrogenase